MKKIQDTTREQRQAYIDEMFHCRSDCDSCGICQVFKGTSPWEVYQDYIDGKREFEDITKERNNR